MYRSRESPMLSFRDPSRTLPLSPTPTALTHDTVRRLVAETLQPVHFFVGPSISLEWEHQRHTEEFWEVFQGRLLDPAQTRRRQAFETWNLFLRDSTSRS